MSCILDNTCDVDEVHSLDEVRHKLDEGWYVMEVRVNYTYVDPKTFTSFVTLMGKTPAGRKN